MKKGISILLTMVMALSMAFTGNVSVEDVQAQESDWQANVITVPAEGALIGAGYIDVEFDNSMEGYTYTVYLDGEPMYWIGDDIVKTEIGEEITADAVIKTFTSEDEGKTEVYTTTVSKHELTVKASDGINEFVSDVRTFYVSKKGLALGGDMSDKVSLKKLNCSWYYNWATEAFNNSVDDGVAHVPMMWGDGEDSKEGILNMTSSSNYILGFNEPDIGTQANMSFFDSVDVWKEYISPLNMRKVSPAPAAPGGDSAWLRRFMNGDYICQSPLTGEWGLYTDYLDDATKTWVSGVGDDIDAVVLHYYRSEINFEGLLEAIETLWETYHKPIWVTELSVFGMKGTSADYSYEIYERRVEMTEFVQKIVENLDDIPYVERYCWFSYDIDSTNEIDLWDGSGATAMFEYASGAYTELGRLYSSIGNPEGYVAEVITDDEMYDDGLEEVITPGAGTEETTAPNSTAGQTTSAPSSEETKITAPGKVSIQKIATKKKSAKKLKVTVKKVSGVNGYQVAVYKTKKNAKNNKKAIVKKLVTKRKMTITSKKLKNKKKLFVRVRAYTLNDNRNKVYGKWSKVKRVKIK